MGLNEQLLEAAKQGNLSEVKLLLNKGANIEAKNARAQTALIKAAEEGKQEVVKLLLDRDANIEARDNAGRTALSLATFLGKTEIVKLLLDRDANIEAKNDRGQTALICATNWKRVEIVKLLLDRGANIEARDNDDVSSLSRAKMFGDEEIANLIESYTKTKSNNAPVTKVSQPIPTVVKPSKPLVQPQPQTPCTVPPKNDVDQQKILNSLVEQRQEQKEISANPKLNAYYLALEKNLVNGVDAYRLISTGMLSPSGATGSTSISIAGALFDLIPIYGQYASLAVDIGGTLYEKADEHKKVKRATKISAVIQKPYKVAQVMEKTARTLTLGNHRKSVLSLKDETEATKFALQVYGELINGMYRGKIASEKLSSNLIAHVSNMSPDRKIKRAPDIGMGR